MTVHAVILAAGEGTRMRSALPKVLHPLAGYPLLLHVLGAALEISERTVVVAGRDEEKVRELLRDAAVEVAVQPERRGTGDALRCALPHLEGAAGDLLVLPGDAPLVRTESLARLLEVHREREAAATVATAILPDPTGYGRIVRDPSGDVLRIVEELDATAEERTVREINAAVYAFRLSPELWEGIEALGTANAKGELYLTDVVALLRERGLPVAARPFEEPEEALGVNTRAELARVHRVYWARNARRLQDEGVTLADPERTYAGCRVQGAPDALVHPGVILEGLTELGAGCEIGPWSRLRDCRIGEGARVLDHCVLEDASLAPGATAGPFARMRGGVELGEDVVVGNFVEIKGSTLGRGTKAKHLSYLGDATIGEGVNVGAGTITCNHDGFRKHRTEIGDGAYLGSHTTLVAPVKVGEGGFVGAASAITRDVSDDALALARSHQVEKEGWARRRREAEEKRRRRRRKKK
jgi:bifunctional UDP-N-acetylglucosamine pyrophosphorylase/glucosamine-1-phosphate N-acetyltransferase